jgi:hypothetical protein
LFIKVSFHVMGQLQKNRVGRMVNPLSLNFNTQGQESSDSAVFGGILAQKPTAICIPAYVTACQQAAFYHPRGYLIRP